MAAHTIAKTVPLSASARIQAGVLSLLLGAFLVWGAGLANSAALHDTAHDTRHSYGFPCH
jgi:cobalt transporter subunit CbtB